MFLAFFLVVTTMLVWYLFENDIYSGQLQNIKTSDLYKNMNSLPEGVHKCDLGYLHIYKENGYCGCAWTSHQNDHSNIWGPSFFIALNSQNNGVAKIFSFKLRTIENYQQIREIFNFMNDKVGQCIMRYSQQHS